MGNDVWKLMQEMISTLSNRMAKKIETEIDLIPKIVSYAGDTCIAIKYTAPIPRKN